MRSKDRHSLTAFLERIGKGDRTLLARLREHAGFPSRDAARHDQLETTAIDDDLARLLARLPNDVLESIVSLHRPVLDIRRENDRPFVDLVVPELETAELSAIREVLHDACPALGLRFDAVGRIDVVSHGATTGVGTGWLAGEDLLVTNRHVVAHLRAMSVLGSSPISDRGSRLGHVVWDYGHLVDEHVPDRTSEIVEILHVSRGGETEDCAILRLARAATDAPSAPLVLADASARPGDIVMAVGHPERDPNSAGVAPPVMDQVFRGTYGCKRLSPGRIVARSGPRLEHDCSTLSGSSGAVLLNREGAVVGLHHRGQKRIANVALDVERLRFHLDRRNWDGVPVVVTPLPGEAPMSIRTADEVRETLSRLLSDAPPGVLGGQVGWRWGDDGVAEPCVVLFAEAERIAEVRADLAAGALSSSVMVEPIDPVHAAEASIGEEAVTSIAYRDETAGRPQGGFDPFTERFRIDAHVGPEAGRMELVSFLDGSATIAPTDRRRLVIGMYEIRSETVVAIVDDLLEKGVKIDMAIDAGRARAAAMHQPAGVDRTRLAAWGNRSGFNVAEVPIGRGGLVATSYHLKVAVRGDGVTWLSSGNWRDGTSLPPPNTRPPVEAPVRDIPGNREWHMVVENARLADILRRHILADLRQSQSLTGSGPAQGKGDEEAEDLWPEREERRAPGRVLPPRRIDTEARVQVLLTPDHGGRIFLEAVLSAMASARDRLWLQVPYVTTPPAPGDHRGNIDALLDELTDRLASIRDGRVLVRRGGPLPRRLAWHLRSKGLDVERCLRGLDDTHAKGMIIDEACVLVGSHNWSAEGVSRNRDASLLFQSAEVTAYYAEAFQIDWDRALPIPDLLPGKGGR